MWADLKNLTLVIFYIYATAYVCGFIIALFTNWRMLKKQSDKN